MSGQVQSVGTANDLATLLIPMNEKQLVLPNVTVAEVIPFVEPEPMDNTPSWFLGTFPWRNQQIPIVSFEALNGEPFLSQSSRRRIAVLNGLVDGQRLPFCAMVTEGMPRLMRVMPDEVAVDEDASELGLCEIGKVLVSGERAVIPNVDYLQQQILTVI